MIGVTLQNIVDVSINWNNPYVQLVVSGVVVGLVILFIEYIFGWKSDGESDSPDQDVDQTQNIEQTIEQTVNVPIGEQQSENSDQDQQSASDSQGESQPEINCYPYNLESGEFDALSEGDDNIPTFENQAMVKVRVEWPIGCEPSWVRVDGGEGVFINFLDKPPNMQFQDDRFRMDRNTTKNIFKMEVSAPNLTGHQDLIFRDTESGEAIHSETLIELGR